MKSKLLIIGYTFPEPATTAAGHRMMQLISLFQEANYEILFATTATESNYSENLKVKGITIKPIFLNDASFDTFVLELQPTVVLFDRYITEEQFGWRVSENCPNALKILDTEDLHFLRKAREDAVKKSVEINLYSEIAKRELASILRCDLSLLISKAELQLLTKTFAIPEGLLYYLPFLVEEFSEEPPSFKTRQHYISMGNFQHAPNTDAVVFLKDEIWPQLKKQLPEAQLHIYGAYVPKHITEMHNEKEGFLVKGWAESVKAVMQQARVCLAPLRFGAGLKGKLLDAAVHGTPSITTHIGGEGMFSMAYIAEGTSAFVEAAVSLYKNEQLWKTQQKQAFEVVRHQFLKSTFSSNFLQKVQQLQAELLQHRQTHFMGQIIQHQSLQATKFMSKWIEEKNTKFH